MGVVGGRLKREGIYVYLQLIHIVVAENNITLLSNYPPIKNKFKKKSSRTFSFHVRKESSLGAKL